jgi:hypothetical protein
MGILLLQKVKWDFFFTKPVSTSTKEFNPLLIPYLTPQLAELSFRFLASVQFSSDSSFKQP